MLVLLAIVIFFVMLGFGRAWRLWGKLRREKRERETAGQRPCRCGYDLAGLTIARCPECGRVNDFDATAEDLGLTDEQLKRVYEAKRKRGEL